MTRPAPAFPAFDEWQNLSESEQDALLDRLEATRKRGSLARRLLVGLVALSACAGLFLATWVLWT